MAITRGGMLGVVQRVRTVTLRQYVHAVLDDLERGGELKGERERQEPKEHLEKAVERGDGRPPARTTGASKTRHGPAARDLHDAASMTRGHKADEGPRAGSRGLRGALAS